MKKRLDIIRALYEEVDDSELLRQDPEFREEYEALGEVKARLDSRIRQRPDSVVLERVFAAAAQGGPRTDRRPVARRNARFRALWASSAATAIVALFAVSLWQYGAEPGASVFGLLNGDRGTSVMAPSSGGAGEGEAVADAEPGRSLDAVESETGRPEASANGELRPGTAAYEAHRSVAAADNEIRSGAAAKVEARSGTAAKDEARPGTAANAVRGLNEVAGSVAAQRTFTSAASPAAGAVSGDVVVRRETFAGGRMARSASDLQQQAALADGAWAADSVLKWDESGDLLQVHRTIERLQAGVELTWDEAVVPLEMLRTGSPSRGFHEAGKKQ